jgi:hypothetical protein
MDELGANPGRGKYSFLPLQPNDFEASHQKLGFRILASKVTGV